MHPAHDQKGATLVFITKVVFWTLTCFENIFKHVSNVPNKIQKSGPEATNFLRNLLIIHPQGAKIGYGAFGRAPGP